MVIEKTDITRINLLLFCLFVVVFCMCVLLLLLFLYFGFLKGEVLSEIERSMDKITNSSHFMTLRRRTIKKLLYKLILKMMLLIIDILSFYLNEDIALLSRDLLQCRRFSHFLNKTIGEFVKLKNHYLVR